MAREMGVPFLGRIPIEPEIVRACDSGQPYVQHYSWSQAAQAFEEVMATLLELNQKTKSIGDYKMRIAIPLAQGKLSLHFGHCDQFAIFEIADDNKKAISRNDETPPAHAPGVLPQWLGGIGVNVIIAAGMGQRAQQLFAQNGIQVVIGAQSGNPEEIVSAYLQSTLVTGDNICDH